ncbi:MAG: 4'-phosphopantetheinyl transferase superfamily protein [Gammaproteobacteria bacterium]|nr:4'-phosphopantetheinyl transferase superfamily protein [Gammaproteobacteria bacterium]
MYWQSVKKIPNLYDDVVHIWRIDIRSLDQCYNRLEKLLLADEIKRADRFVFPQGRAMFVLSRGILRYLLSVYLKRNVNDIEFCHNSYGKPRLCDDGLFFNLSHSNDLILISFSARCDLGIDVEYMKSGIDFVGIAKRYFSLYEINQLEGFVGEDLCRAFYRCWSRKESFLKALGVGLAHNLKNFDVNVADGSENLLKDVREPVIDWHNWQMLDLSIDVDYAAALTIAGACVDVQGRVFSPNLLGEL